MPSDGLEASDADLAAAAAILVEFSEAASDNDGNRVVAAGRRLAQVGGFRSLEDLFGRIARHGNDETYRQWWWLLAVARNAARRADLTTVALAFLFAELWRTQVAPKTGPSDLEDVGFPGPPDQVHADLAVLALTFLIDQGPRQVVASGSNPVDVAHVLAAASMRLIALHNAGLDIRSDFVELAQQVLA